MSEESARRESFSGLVFGSGVWGSSVLGCGGLGSAALVCDVWWCGVWWCDVLGSGVPAVWCGVLGSAALASLSSAVCMVNGTPCTTTVWEENAQALTSRLFSRGKG